MTDPHADSDAIASLQALAAALAELEPELQRWLAATADTAIEPERARRAALHLRTQVSRILAVLDVAPAGAAAAPWHGQERRSPLRATNVARLPERPAASRSPAEAGQDWEPF